MTEGTQAVRVPFPGQDLAAVAIPGDNGAIQSAFDKLDAQMDAWLGAMKRAEQTLAAGLAACGTSPASSRESSTGGSSSPAEHTSRVAASPSLGKTDSQSLAVQSSSDRPPEAASSQTVEQPPAVPAPAEAVVTETVVAETAVADEMVVDAVESVEAVEIVETVEEIEAVEANSCESPAAIAASEESASEEALPAQPSSPAQGNAASAGQRADDEALLATLDETTANAIRVMRRMCMNQKSVRELLSEYEARKDSQPAAAHNKKSWFRRGK